MPEIKIKVRDKRAGGTGTVICGNSDYTVVWDLDEEWTPYDTKTMRVKLADGTYRVHGKNGEFLCLSRAENGTLTSIKNFFGA